MSKNSGDTVYILTNNKDVSLSWSWTSNVEEWYFYTGEEVRGQETIEADLSDLVDEWA